MKRSSRTRPMHIAETRPVPFDAALQRLHAALEKRRPLRADRHTNAVRLFHGQGDGIPGFVLEQFDHVLVAQLHEGRTAVAPEDARRLCEEILGRVGARAVYRKIFSRDRSGSLPGVESLHTDPQPWIGSPAEPDVLVRENGLHFLVRPYDGFSVGLFLEHRDNRQMIRARAAGKRVLNLFAYTCGFSVCAAASGAAETVSVDLSKKYLEWGKRNFAANGLSLDSHHFFCSDVFEFFRRAERQGRRFDLIVLDPPSFSRLKRPKRSFALKDDLENLVRGTLALLEPGGLLLLAVNHRGIAPARLEQAARAGAAGRPVQVVERPALPADFPGDPGYAKSLLVQID